LKDKPKDLVGNEYEAVLMGNQTWMAENLNYEVEDSKCYDDDPANCERYGRLYDWATAMAFSSTCNYDMCGSQINTLHQGICPEGWHIPSDREWDTLMGFVNHSCTSASTICSNAGTYLKASSSWNSNSGVPTGTDDFGFSALAAGVGGSAGGTIDINTWAAWWSATEYYYGYAYSRFIRSSTAHVNRQYSSKPQFFSVRCVKD